MAYRGYYGTLNHNAKAVYQRYLGWFDGNPANLAAPAGEAGRRYVELAGGAGRAPRPRPNGVRRAGTTDGSPSS